MNRRQLKEQLVRAGVPEENYFIAGIDSQRTPGKGGGFGELVLTPAEDHHAWRLVTEERGRIQTERRYATEAAACEAAIPTAGHDLVLIGLFTAVGVAFGLLGGLLTRVRAASGNVYIKATASAAALWVLSMGLRMGFAVWSSYGSGVSHLTSFSAAHDITSGQAWVTALILMAFGEVIVRLGTIIVRGQLASARGAGTARRYPAELARTSS